MARSLLPLSSEYKTMRGPPLAHDVEGSHEPNLRWHLQQMLTSMLVAALFCLLPQTGFAEGIPALKILEGNDDGTEYSLSLQLIIVMTLLGLLPSI